VFGPATVIVLEAFAPRPPEFVSRTVPLARVVVPWKLVLGDSNEVVASGFVLMTSEFVAEPVIWPASRTVPPPVPLNTSCWFGFANPRLLVIATAPDPLFVTNAAPVAASKVIGLPPIVTAPDPAMPDGFEKFK